MSAAVKITRKRATPKALRAKAAESRDAAQCRRLLAIALVLEGCPRGQAARQAGMDRQTLRDWVIRYNESGVEGLASRVAPGAAPKLTAEQMQKLREVVLAGPDRNRDQIVRWRCADLRHYVAEQFSVEVAERTIGKWLRKLGMTRLQPRPYHPKKSVEAQETFKTNFSESLKQILKGSTAARGIEVWMQDEARVGQKGGHAYVWAPVGSRPPMVRDNRHDFAYLFGAICPARGIGAAIITPTVNTEWMSLHLREISTLVGAGRIGVIVCDGAGWHQIGGELEVPANLVLLPLPPYSPELNPMENVWQFLRANKLCARVWKNYAAIVDACKRAWNWLIADPDRISSIGHRAWATVNV